MDAHPSFHLQIPPIIGPFRVLRLLGVGGMGTVYLAERMDQFSQLVAIKIIYPSIFPAAVDATIKREGEVLATLEHPGVVRILDLGITDNGLRYIVMEYVDGVPLDIFCDDRRLSILSRIRILLDVFDAIEHVHRHLVVHADLKPENIYVTAEGKSRLLDFGVARVLSDLGASRPGAKLSALQANEIKEVDEGSYTALYASPEQLSGERVTVASDIYSLGLITQNLLTGIRPRPMSLSNLHPGPEGASGAVTSKEMESLDSNLLSAIASTRATTSHGLVSTIRGDLEAILAKALKLDPKERFQSAHEMREELERFFHGYPIHTRPTGRLTRAHKWMLRNRVAACLGCVFLFVVLFSILGVVKQATEAARKRQLAQTRLHDLVRLTDVLAGDLYESVRELQGAETAQAALLNSAHETIYKLAADDGQDSQLDLELAREYEKLARLELNRTPTTADALQRTAEDLDRESRILDEMNRRDPEVMRLRDGLPHMIELLDVAKRQNPRGNH